MTQDFDSQFKSAAEETSRLKATLKNKDALLQEKEKELRASVEKTGRSERKASKHHVSCVVREAHTLILVCAFISILSIILCIHVDG